MQMIVLSKENMTYADIIAKRINDLCKELNISINKLAALSGLRQSTLQNIMLGNTLNPTIKTLNKIAKGLSMTLAELLDFSEINDFK